VTAWRVPFDLSSKLSRLKGMQDNTRGHQTGSDERLALIFIFFCIACVALTGVFLMAYVYWGFQ
jgi:hypothetical protein